jgi:putative phosphoribosyl transferase
LEFYQSKKVAMETVKNKWLLDDRLEAGNLLAHKLLRYKNASIVIAIPNGGVPVGYAIAKQLAVPMDVYGCKKIKHPAKRLSTIGAVSLDAITWINTVRDIPQDYVVHKTALLQHTIRRKCNYFRGGNTPIHLEGKTVILVDDQLQTGQTMLAVIKSLRALNPKEIIVSVPVTSLHASYEIVKEADHFVFLMIEGPEYVQQHFSSVSDHEVLGYMELNKKEQRQNLN